MALPGTTSPDVLLISRCPPYPLNRGDRLIPYNLARQLHRRGYQIDLLAFYQEPEDQADIPYYEKYFKEVTLIPEPTRSPLSLMMRAADAGRRFPRRKSQSWSPAMWEAIEERLQQRRVYDVVHLFGGVHVFEFRELFRNYPVIIAPYESFSLYMERALTQAKGLSNRGLTFFKRGVARQYESWMYQGYQRVVVVSEADALMLRRINPKLPVEVIPNGVDLDRFVPTGEDPDTPTLLFTGNFDYQPNLDAALLLARKILPAVQREVPEANLLLAGANPPQRLRDLSNRGDIRVTGSVPDLRPFFEAAMVYVSPLRLGAGIKNKILEALAMQKPLVATPVSCDGINVTPGRDVLMAETPDEITRAVIRLLKDRALRTDLALAGRRLIEEQYTWRRVADSYEDLYAAVMRERDVRNW